MCSEDNESVDDKYNAYTSYRNELIQIKNSEQDKIDSALYTLSISLIAASFAYFSFVLDHQQNIYYMAILYTSWSFSVLSLCLTFLSSLFSKEDCSNSIPILDKFYEDGRNIHQEIRTSYTSLVHLCNQLSFIFFISGVILTGLFIYVNPLGKNSEICPCMMEVSYGK